MCRLLQGPKLKCGIRVGDGGGTLWTTKLQRPVLTQQFMLIMPHISVGTSKCWRTKLRAGMWLPPRGQIPLSQGILGLSANIQGPFSIILTLCLVTKESLLNSLIFRRVWGYDGCRAQAPAPHASLPRPRPWETWDSFRGQLGRVSVKSHR